MPNTITTRQLITMQRVNGTGGVDVLYPKTIASQVYVDGSTTVAQHVADTNAHLSSEERTAMSLINQANGFVKLDTNGFVPSANLNPSVLAVHTEFANIAAMLAATDADVARGQLVMVIDASADTTVDAGWAIYRRLMTSDQAAMATLAGWQKIAEGESLDVVVNWANIVGAPTSAVGDIDDAVTKKHAHANATVLDGLTDDGVLKYNNSPIAFTADVVTVTVASEGSEPAVNTLKTGDLIFSVTGTSAF